jgi:hypothetical protein
MHHAACRSACWSQALPSSSLLSSPSIPPPPQLPFSSAVRGSQVPLFFQQDLPSFLPVLLSLYLLCLVLGPFASPTALPSLSRQMLLTDEHGTDGPETGPLRRQYLARRWGAGPLFMAPEIQVLVNTLAGESPSETMEVPSDAPIPRVQVDRGPLAVGKSCNRWFFFLLSFTCFANPPPKRLGALGSPSATSAWY